MKNVIVLLVAIALITIAASNVTSHYVWGYKWGPVADKLYSKMVKLGYSDYHAKLIINKCKKYNPKGGVKNCVVAIASIGVAESAAFHRCYKNNCLGLAGGRFHYKSISTSLDDWIKRYNKYRYTWYWKGKGKFFYSLYGKPSLSRYCTSEISSGNKKYHCINGYKHFMYSFNFLNK